MPDGSLSGTNNDCYGFINSVKQEQPGWRADAGPVVVIGAGGGSRAVCYGLAQEGAKEIRLVNRSLDRAQGRRRGVRRPDPGAVVGGAQRRARGRSDGRQHHELRHGRAAALWTSASTSCRRPRSPPTSSTFRSRRRFSPRRASAATARSTGWGCSSIRADRRGRRGSAIEPEVTPELRAMVERTI